MTSRHDLPVGVIAKTATSWPVYVADHLGLFAAHGLAVRVAESGDADTQFARLLDGRYAIGHQNADHALRAVARGAELRILARLMRPLYALVAHPSVRGYPDLRGATVVVEELGRGHGVLAPRMLERNGLGSQACSFVAARTSAERLGLLREGRAAAGLFEPSTAAALLLEGFRLLDTSWSYLEGHLGPVAVATAAWVRDHPAAARDYVAAYTEAVDWLLDASHRAPAAAILAQATGISQEVALATYDLVAAHPKVFDPRAPVTFEEVLAHARRSEGTQALTDAPERLAALCEASLV